MDAFDRAFQRCSKEEQEQILKMSAEEFGRELAKSFGVGDDRE